MVRCKWFIELSATLALSHCKMSNQWESSSVGRAVALKSMRRGFDSLLLF